MSLLKSLRLVRSFRTSAADRGGDMIKPPVQVFGLEGRYASALYSAASKNKVLEDVEKELTSFQESMKKDPKVKEFMVNPIIKRNEKAEALKHVSSKIGLSTTSANLLGIMAENGRLNKLEAVINAYKLMMAAHRGEVTCEVITAKPLDSSQRSALEAALKKLVSGKQSLRLTAKVDPSIIGGMIVSVGDKYVDMSVASKVKKYTDLISAAV